MHPDDDKLLSFALDLCAKSQRSDVEDHLADCSSCRSRFEKLEHDIGLIGAIRPVQAANPPSKRVFRLSYRRNQSGLTRSLLPAAALIILGFTVGFLAASSKESEPVRVVGQHLAVAPPAESLSYYPPADATLGDRRSRSVGR